LVIAEEEELVLDHRPAGTAAKLIPLRHRDETVGARDLAPLRERVAGLEMIVTKELEADRVEIVRARPSLRAHDARRGAEFGVVIRRRDLGFGH